MEKIYRYDTNTSVNHPICVVYNQEIKFGNSGTLSLRKGSRTGEIIESFDIGSDRLLLNVTELIVYPLNPLPYETEIHVTVSDGFVVSTMNGSGFSGLEENGSEEFYFATQNALGNPLDGGTVVAKDEGGYYWVAAPENTEINGSWNEIFNIIARVSEETSTTGWHLPSLFEMQNSLYANKQYWATEGSNLYWTTTEVDALNANILRINDNIPEVAVKEDFYKIRLFKKVIY